MKKLGAIIASVAMIGSTLIGGSAVYADQLNQGMYNFVCVDGGRYLNVYAGHDWDGVNVCVWEKDGSPEQNFKMVDRGGNRYVLYPSSSNGRVLDANRGNSYSNPLQAGNNIDIWQTNDTEAQEWYIDDRGGGKYTIELVHARGLVVTCDNPSANNGNCSLQRYTGASNQLWYLQRTDGGSVKPETPAVSTPAPDTSNQSSYKTGIYSIKYQGTNLRSGAGLDHSVVAVVNAGTELNVTAVSGEWGKTNYDGKDCWIRLNGFADYVREASSATPAPAPSPEPTPEPAPETTRTGYVANTGSSLRVRAEANTNCTVLGTLKDGSTVTVKGDNKVNGFWKVDYNGITGYCHGDWISFSKPTSQSVGSVRTSAPGENAQYYSSGNIFYPTFAPPRVGLGNCTWYAWGRIWEITGKKPASGIFNGNAHTWWTRNNIYATGSTPKVGAIAVWKPSLPGSGGCGHVAVVEKIENGKVYISESSYPNVRFRYREIYSTNYLYGYIYVN